MYTSNPNPEECDDLMDVIRKEAHRYKTFDGTATETLFRARAEPAPMMFGDPQHLPYATAEQTWEQMYGTPTPEELELAKRPTKAIHEIYGSDYMFTDNPREQAYRQTFAFRTAESEGWNGMGDEMGDLLARDASVRMQSLNRYEVVRRTNNPPALAAEPGICGGPGGAAPNMSDFYLGKLGTQRIEYENAPPCASSTAGGHHGKLPKILPTSRISEFEPWVSNAGGYTKGESDLNDHLAGARIRPVDDGLELVFTSTSSKGLAGGIERNPYEGGRGSLLPSASFEWTAPQPSPAGGGQNMIHRSDFLGGVHWTKTDAVEFGVSTAGHSGDYGGPINFGVTVPSKLHVGPVNPSIMIPSGNGGFFVAPETYVTLPLRKLNEAHSVDGTPFEVLREAALMNDERQMARTFKGEDLDELDFIV